jgi:hypothetical protein
MADLIKRKLKQALGSTGGYGICSLFPQYPVNDAFLSGSIYFGLSMLFPKWQAGLGALILATTAEFLQNNGSIPGTYDPKDLLAYTIGVAGAVTLDVLVNRKIGEQQ